MRTILRSLVVLGAAMLLLLASACGSSADQPGKGGFSAFSTAVAANQIEVNTDDRLLKWERSEYSAPAGDMTFVVKNRSTIAHNFVVRGNGVNAISKNLKANSTTRLTLEGLLPGDYLIICTLPGHEEAGMVARLKIT